MADPDDIHAHLPIRIAGADVGFARTGIVIAELRTTLPEKILHTETIEILPLEGKKVLVADSDLFRLKGTLSRLLELNEEWGVQLWGAEIPSGGSRGGRASRCMALATGMWSAMGVVTRSHAVSFIPSRVKKKLTGNSNAKKPQIAACVLSLFPDFDDWPEPPTTDYKGDVFDAAAVFPSMRDHPVYQRLMVALRGTGLSEDELDNPRGEDEFDL